MRRIMIIDHTYNWQYTAEEWVKRLRYQVVRDCDDADLVLVSDIISLESLNTLKPGLFKRLAGRFVICFVMYPSLEEVALWSKRGALGFVTKPCNELGMQEVIQCAWAKKELYGTS